MLGCSKAATGRAVQLLGHLPAPLSTWSAWDAAAASLMQPIQVFGFHDVCLTPIPDPAHTEHEHRTELFSSSFSIQHLQSLLQTQTELPCFGSFSAARKPSPTALAWQLRDRTGSKAERDLYLNRAKRAYSVG